MSKHDHQQEHKHEESHQQSHNEVHVETHTESHVSSGADVQDRLSELTDDLKRVQAEFVNYRRRAESEKADLTEYAKTRVVRDFLTVRDSFDHELAHRPTGADPAWAKSIDAIRTQFDQVLSQLGVERFESKGQPFDPHLHNAVAMEDGEGDQEVVVEELQPGYKLAGTVLRHAIVKVGHVE
ncbi:MAG TPA: nucleotide exchange factor GrpE [Candidatus Saccharimonadia bacterium]|jgi:molecular chaperone GrpE